MAGKIALDTGALIALARGNEDARAIVERWTRAGYETVVAAPVLAETLRGTASDAAMNRILRSRAAAVTILPIGEKEARDAGRRIGRASRKNVTVDALIVAASIGAGASEIISGDPDDLRALCGRDMRVIPI